jgi:hypothetical protein
MGALTEKDGYGLPAYLCARDRTPLEPLADAPGVLRCPTCGHRTDASGEGVLGDGFDILHRQWGLRGDPHAWSAMRELVAATPTPAEHDAIRAAYLDALRQVTEIDLDGTAEAVVYREHLDHGGMSGGGLDLAWWRTKGIPLLVDRAAARRPASRPCEGASTDSAASRPRRGVKRAIGDLLALVAVLAIPAATFGGGAYLLYERAVGTRVEATVIGCDVTGGVFRRASNYREDCVAAWTIEGETVVGGLSGGSGGWEPGETVDATVRGDTAYSRSLGLPILLIALGLPFLAIPVLAARAKRRGRRRGSGARPP